METTTKKKQQKQTPIESPLFSEPTPVTSEQPSTTSTDPVTPAWTGSNSDTNTPSQIDTPQKEPIKTPPKDTPSTPDKSLSEQEKERVKKEINSYITETYKLQWNKILKDIDASLKKLNLTEAEQVDAYEKIQETLRERKKVVISNQDMTSANKQIIINYLDYMISSIEKKKKLLSE